MLVLSRRPRESITIGDNIVVTVLAVNDGQVRLGITAPHHVQVLREETYQAIQEENHAAARGLRHWGQLERAPAAWWEKKQQDNLTGSLQGSEMQQKTAASCLMSAGQEFFFPEGLIGLATYRRFVLTRYQLKHQVPYLLLQAQEEHLAFPLLSPQWLTQDYPLSVPVEVLTKLGAASLADVVVLVMLTLREQQEETSLNLQGPLLLSPVSRLGLQLVAEDHPVRFPLFAG